MKEKIKKWLEENYVLPLGAQTICIICIACFGLFLSTSCGKKKPTSTDYPATAVVMFVNHEQDIVIVQDYQGFVWEFYGAEDWQVGDGCSLIMNDNGTDNITDDIIVKAFYNGWTLTK